MGLLILGVAIFIAVHLIPCVPALRTSLVESLGAFAYKIIFGLIAIAGVVIIVLGFANAPFEPVYQPPEWGRSVTLTVVPLAFILFAASKMSTHIRMFLHHPMLIGLMLFAAAHLAVNGDLRSVILFGGLGAYATIATISSVAQGKKPDAMKPPRLAMDAAAVVIGLALTGIIAFFHFALFGMPVV